LDQKSFAERQNFINLNPGAQNRLRGLKSIVMAALPAGLDAFYQKIRAIPETVRFFGSDEAIRHAKGKQHEHWDLITDGRLDENYMAKAAQIGQTHFRIGLEPRWYIAGYALLLEHLNNTILSARWPKFRFGPPKVHAKQVAEELNVLMKATFLDMELALSTYFSAQVQAAAAAQAQAAAVAQAQTAIAENVVNTMSRAMNALAAGDLTHRIGDSMPPEYSKLRLDFNNALERLAGVLAAIQDSSHAISGNVEELSQASDDLSRRTEQQAASLEETAAALDQITATVRKTAEGASEARSAVAAAKADAESSGEVVREAVSAMSGIEASSKQIGNIIGVIDEIAFQTNLLALNAGVEAARAGDAGRGFAVVATEVRALAQRSADAAKEIKTLISASGQQVEAGVKLVGDTGKALGRIVEQVTKLNGLVSDIAASAQEQAAGLNQVNTAVNQMDRVTQQNAAMVEQSTAAVHSLKHEIDGLNRVMATFCITANEPQVNHLPSSPTKRRELVS
jgi:methyl-accepting chemotaxis protein